MLGSPDRSVTCRAFQCTCEFFVAQVGKEVGPDVEQSVSVPDAL
jgi:hypothetical protein